jgi:hypothetical protein
MREATRSLEASVDSRSRQLEGLAGITIFLKNGNVGSVTGKRGSAMGKEGRPLS